MQAEVAKSDGVIGHRVGVQVHGPAEGFLCEFMYMNTGGEFHEICRISIVVEYFRAHVLVLLIDSVVVEEFSVLSQGFFTIIHRCRYEYSFCN